MLGLSKSDGTATMRKDVPDQSLAPVSPSRTPVAENLQLLSHDIRSAMSDVIGGLRLIDRDRLPPETQIQIARIQAAGTTLAALVDDALMAALGETAIQRDDGDVPVAAWVSALTGRWSGRALESGCRFEVTTGDSLPSMVLVPRIPLDRIVGNLISNALNHAADSAVSLRIDATPGEDMIISVLDDGPGFPKLVLEQVLEGDGAVPMGQRAGSGLGLRIAVELSRQIGGALALINRSGGGSLARLRLPEHLVSWDKVAQPPRAAPDLSGLKILVAEDNLTNQTILRQLLEKMRADAVFVVDGAAALDVLDRQAFDIALIDIEMPRMSGLQVMQAVRDRADAVAQMPLVALTAYVLRDNREAIYAAGADGIIGKPISSGQDFGRAILRYAGRPSGLPEPEDVLENGVDDTGLGQKLDSGRFDALMDVAGADGRPELMQRLHEDLCAVRTGLDDAVTAQNVPEIRGQTHVLIAISGAVGADRLSRLSEVLNIAAKRRRMGDLNDLYAPCRADLSDLIGFVKAQASAFGIDLPQV